MIVFDVHFVVCISCCQIYSGLARVLVYLITALILLIHIQHSSHTEYDAHAFLSSLCTVLRASSANFCWCLLTYCYSLNIWATLRYCKFTFVNLLTTDAGARFLFHFYTHFVSCIYPNFTGISNILYYLHFRISVYLSWKLVIISNIQIEICRCFIPSRVV